MNVDIAGALRELERLIERMQELIEWEKLFLSERKPHVPPSFQPTDHFRDDVEQMYAWFWNLVYSIHEVLDRDDFAIPERRRCEYRHRLGHLEEQFGRAVATANHIKP